MDSANKIRQVAGKIVWTVFTVVLLLVVIAVMISHVYSLSEEESFEKLHLETQQIKKNINLQMLSDRENLITMSNLASELYENGSGYDLLFDSFEKIGLFEDIGVLTDNGDFCTRYGKTDVSDKISFEEECVKGEYISGRVSDMVDSEREVVRSCVPIKRRDGTVVALLYGVINLDVLLEKFVDDVESIGAELFVVEGGSGNYIIDTRHDTLGNITYLASSTFQKGYSYDELINNLSVGTPGFTAYLTKNEKDLLYAHYAPLDFSDWQIMLAQPKEVVFASARATSNYLSIMAAIIIFIMASYLMFIFIVERRKLKINSTASGIRKALLEINQQFDKIYDALKSIAGYACARASFVVDMYGDAYGYDDITIKNHSLSKSDKAYFISKIQYYSGGHRKTHGAAIHVAEIAANDRLRRDDIEFYRFLEMHGISRICFVVVINNTSNSSVLGVINPRRKTTVNLLREIAVCFSMAIHNQKYLSRTEEMALSDALTGIKNRMAYKHDIKHIDIKAKNQFACVYIDVNELHYFNGRYGHAAGDQMLSFVAETLKSVFPVDSIYRMGGDEFLAFSEDVSPEELKNKLAYANEKIEEMKYHVSIGVRYADESIAGVDELVNEAEKEMYNEKAKYYQSKEASKSTNLANRKMESYLTGIKEIDAYISVMSVQCLGVFCLSHKTDIATQILAPTYFAEIMSESGNFSDVMKRYTYDIVKPEFHRMLIQFIEYDVLEKQLQEVDKVSITYTKIDGESVTLSIYRNNKNTDDIDTVWVFEKSDS